MKEVVEFANRYYHDKALLRHVELVREYSLKLAEIENCDKKVVEIAAILHDIGKSECREGHSHRSYEMSREFVESMDLSDEQKRLVLKCILKHSSRFSDEENEIEVKVIQSADALAVLFDDEWQEYSRKSMEKDILKGLYDKTYSKINIDSARNIAKQQIERLMSLL